MSQYTDTLDQWRKRRRQRKRADRKRKELNMTQLDVINRIQRKGPNRVVVDANGLAVPPLRAVREFGQEADVVFVRDDGWMLGTPIEFYNIALEMWDESWVWEYDRNTRKLRPVSRPRRGRQF